MLLLGERPKQIAFYYGYYTLRISFMKMHASSVFNYFGKLFLAALLLLVMACHAPTLAQDGPQLAAAAKKAAENMQAYLRDLEKSGGQPDYSKPPASEYLKRIFDADALAALPAPKADDLDWLFEWFDAADHGYKAMAAFGAKNKTPAELNLALSPEVADRGQGAGAHAEIGW
jgi:hypothetical protein